MPAFDGVSPRAGKSIKRKRGVAGNSDESEVRKGAHKQSKTTKIRSQPSKRDNEVRWDEGDQDEGSDDGGSSDGSESEFQASDDESEEEEESGGDNMDVDEQEEESKSVEELPKPLEHASPLKRKRDDIEEEPKQVSGNNRKRKKYLNESDEEDSESSISVLRAAHAKYFV